MSSPRKIPWVPLVVVTGTVVLVVTVGALFLHDRDEAKPADLASMAKGVTVVEAQSSTFRERHRYVGTIQPWVAANVGPQLVSAYVATVLVRPGSVVKRGQVLATLDCRSTSSASKAVEEQARALAATQAAVAAEASRVKSLLKGKYVSPDEVQMKEAEAENKQAQLLATKAQLMGTSLEVNDCVMRSPFDGEVSDRYIDPGAFVRPGTPVVQVVDRDILRVTADVPEEDFDAVADKTPLKIHVLATGATLTAPVSRRAPSADASTRTIHVEADVPDPNRVIPVGTTAVITVNVGQPINATEIPLVAADVGGSKATVFVLDGNVVRKRSFKVIGERKGNLYVSTMLQPGTWVVTEGRETLRNNDVVSAKHESTEHTGVSSGSSAPPVVGADTKGESPEHAAVSDPVKTSSSAVVPDPKGEPQ